MFKERERKNIGDIWKEREGSKIYWIVQFPFGKMSYTTKKEAMKWVAQLQKEYGI